MKPIVVAKCALLNSAGEVLLLRRSASDTKRPGEWDFPGGWVEGGEDIKDGAARETLEEAGIEISPADLLLIYTATEPYETTGQSVTRLLFAGKTDTAEVKLSFEHDAARWVDIDTALKEFPHPFYATGLKYAVIMIFSNRLHSLSLILYSRTISVKIIKGLI